jgi:dipeptidyl aminopeptidase/acylaminoacyl peptidase
MYLLSPTNKLSITTSTGKQFFVRLFFLLVLVLPFSFSTTANNSSAVNNKTSVLPISAYGHLPMVSNVQLSPNGNRIAMLKNLNGNQVLMTYNLVNGESQAILQSDNIKITLNWYVWGNDDVLLISTGSLSKEGTTKYTTTRLYKYDLSADKELSLLVKPKKSHKEKGTQIQDNVISLMPGEPDKILMAINFEHWSKPSLYEVNIRTKQRSRVKRYKTYIDDWYADQQGKPRITYKVDDTEISYKLFNTAGELERDLWSYEVFEQDVVNILGFDVDPNILFIQALHQGKYAVFKVDLTDKELSRELVFADANYDVNGSLIYSPKTGAVVGLSHEGDNDNKIYWDKEYLAFKQALNAALPDSDNTIISMSKNQNKYVLYSSSMQRPGDYLLGDRKNKKLEFLASLYPEIDASNYATKELVQYEARDGLQIEGYLTTPLNTPKNAKLPAIIFPHGGPMARDYAGFDYWSELFANRGYLVFQPNFRGSSGYGYEFEMASVKGWGLAMQDDLQDATHWLIKQGLVDAKKVCIAGASYGGYAALMAAVKHSDTFKCAASFAGVTDLEQIIRDANAFSNKKVVRKQIGTDSDQLEATSPVNFANKINVPILLIHGTDDQIVPVKHSQVMAAALAQQNKQVDYIEIEEANHHLSNQGHRIKTLEAMADFFAKHLH